ncbi:MAG: hypothetical protein AAF391_01460, partial [Bacteroidota bacterium]
RFGKMSKGRNMHVSLALSEADIVNLTPKSISAFNDFVGLIKIPTFKRQLRSLLLYYLSEEHEELPSNYGYFIEDMKFLFDFLDVVEDEIRT